MTFERKRLARQKIRHGEENAGLPLVWQFTPNNAKAVPETPTITIYKPGDTTATVDAAEMDVAGTLVSYIVDATDTAVWPALKGYRAEVVATIGEVEYKGHFFFDVAKFVFQHTVTADSLLAIDRRVEGMQGGDIGFARKIGACADEFQVKIESRIVEAERMRLEWLVDPSAADVAFARFVLSRIFREASDHESANEHRDAYVDILESVLSTTSPDSGEAGAAEGGGAGNRVDDVRFEL